eukprot:COSAG04_NODE_15464_length_531_cov_0.863426_2_plen_36_part_01
MWWAEGVPWAVEGVVLPQRPDQRGELLLAHLLRLLL